ncbi:12231_t:CDS:2, partial [Funneliformis geosporum]
MEISSDRHSQLMLDSPIIYRLEVSQQPIRARMCGFGDKDRRPIDPPPVVRLLVSTADGTPIPESSVDHSMMIVHAGLWSESCTDERSLVINPSSIPTQSTGPSSTVMSLNAPSCTRNLMGHCTSSAYVLTNDLGQQGIYFIFQDLSVRTEGTFTLKFSFCDVKSLLVRSLNGYTNSRGSVAAEVYSDPFKVYSAKKFPGMTVVPGSSSSAVPTTTISDTENTAERSGNDEKRSRQDLSDNDDDSVKDSEEGKDKFLDLNNKWLENPISDISSSKTLSSPSKTKRKNKDKKYREVNGKILIFYTWCEKAGYNNQMTKGCDTYKKDLVDRHVKNQEHTLLEK